MLKGLIDNFALTVVFGTGLVLFASYCWSETFFLASHSQQKQSHYRRFHWWAIQGLVVPALIFFLLTSGVLPSSPWLIPEVELARSPGQFWSPLLFSYWCAATFSIVTYWTAVTLLWITVWMFVKAHSRRDLVVTTIFWCVLTSPIILLLWKLTGWHALSLGLITALAPIIHFNLPFAPAMPHRPSYSSAVAKMKFGKYADAESEVVQQLERAEHDYEGWMMLATLYASHFHDLPEADRTIRELCLQPNVTPAQVSLALNRLADWHLRIGNDPAAARSALEHIEELLPHTHAAKMARIRISQMPATREEWELQKEPRRIGIHTADDEFETPAPDKELTVTEATLFAQEAVAKLEKDPNDIRARARLATLLAEHMANPEAGIEQLKLLTEISNQPETKIAEWLFRMAAWHYRLLEDTPTAQSLLKRIVREYPQSPHAFMAQRHLHLLPTSGSKPGQSTIPVRNA